MNKIQLYNKREESISLLDRRCLQNNKKNTVIFGKGESIDHAKKKLEFCYYLHKKGKQFYTEAIFKSGGEADIFVLDDKIAVEILKSEPESSIIKKKLNYPCMVVEVRMNQSFEEIFGD